MPDGAFSWEERREVFPRVREAILSAPGFNMRHDFEHCGNLVTSMRMNGMEPPSSQGQK